MNETVLGDPGYWVEHARQTVRFADGVVRAGHGGTFISLRLAPGVC